MAGTFPLHHVIHFWSYPFPQATTVIPDHRLAVTGNCPLDHVWSDPFPQATTVIPDHGLAIAGNCPLDHVWSDPF